MQYVQPVPFDGYSIWSMILGIVAVLTGTWAWLLWEWPAALFGLPAAILGWVAYRRISLSRHRGFGMALSGMIMGGICVASAICWTILWLVLVGLGAIA